MANGLRVARGWLAAGAALGAAACAPDQGFKGGFGGANEPDVLVEPSQLLYELVPYGDLVTQTFTVTNQGDATLIVDDVRLSGSGAFTVVTTPLAFSLESGASTDIDVAYTPTTAEDSGMAWVVSNDPDSPEAPVELLGTAGSPRLQIDPNAWDFGVLALQCSDSIPVTLSNVGTATLTIDTITEIGEGFAVENVPTLPIDIEPGDGVVVDVSFTPLVEHSYVGALYVESNDPSGTKMATQDGIGNAEGVCLQVTPGETLPLDLEYEVEYKLADIAFLLDTTCSMSGLAQAMADEFASIAGTLTADIPDITFGVVTYDDYNWTGGTGSGSDKPFFLRQQQTDDVAVVQAKLNAVGIHSGDDTTESSFEALLQAAEGKGYDQDCDGKYDTTPDVYPFIADGSDAFGGAEPGTYDASVSGTGDQGGMGFRQDVLPIFILATDAPLRDADSGDPTPGGCPQDAGRSDALTAMAALNAKFIGIGVNAPTSGNPYNQLVDVAESTGSFGDMDGDGSTEAAAVTWNGSSSDFREAVVDAVNGLVQDAHFDKVQLVVVDDPYNMVESIDPEAYYDVDSGEKVTFTVTFVGTVSSEETDQTYPVTFNLVADDEIILETTTVFIFVPGA